MFQIIISKYEQEIILFPSDEKLAFIIQLEWPYKFEIKLLDTSNNPHILIVLSPEHETIFSPSLEKLKLEILPLCPLNSLNNIQSWLSQIFIVVSVPEIILVPSGEIHKLL